MPTNKAFNSNVQYEIDNQRHHRTFWQLAFIKHCGRSKQLCKETQLCDSDCPSRSG